MVKISEEALLFDLSFARLGSWLYTDRLMYLIMLVTFVVIVVLALGLIVAGLA